MTLGPLMVDLAGTELSAEDSELLCNPLVGGVVLFTRNYTDHRQLQRLCASIHALREPRLLVAVDQEGGRVQRFRDDFTRLPPMAALGALHDRDTDRARNLTERLGWLMASELLACGVDVSFAPVLDLRRGTAIGDRAFHRDPVTVGSLGSALMRGMRKAGMAATGKHFPGHGSVNVDSHVATPVDERDYANLVNHDLLPFTHAIRNGLGAVMAAHVVFSHVDALPACFSSVWLQDRLRDTLKFDGAVLTDDLSMAGAAVVGDTLSRVQHALTAGCDVVLVCNDRQACIDVVDGLQYEDDPISQLRRTRLHGRAQIDWDDLHGLDEWQFVSDAVARLDFAPELGL
jgi:beta-N-acetylhexosaminidase